MQTQQQDGRTDGIARRHIAQLYGQALHLTANHHDAMDLVQDTLEASLRKLPTALPEDRMVFWLAAVLRNRFIDSCRSLECRGRSVSANVMELALCAAEQTEEPKWAKADPKKLQLFVQLLKPVLRNVFQLRAYERLSYAEIAARLGIPISTVGTRYHRAIGHLRRALVVDAS